METLTNIQTDFQLWANASTETLTSGANLRMFNQVFRGLCTPEYRLMGRRIGRRWPELTRENTTLASVASQEQYTWISSPGRLSGVTQPHISRPFYVEYLDASSSDYPYPLTEVTDMDTWNAYDSAITQTGIPVYYRLIDVLGVLKIALRPIPDTTGDTIRITGLIVPLPWPATYKTTVDAASASAQKVLNIAATTPFQIGSLIQINDGGSTAEPGVVATVTAGVSVTMNTNLTSTHNSPEVVELATPFLDPNVDHALSMFIAAVFKAGKGDPQRASELIDQGIWLLPAGDTTPKLRGGGYIHPWCV